MFKKARDGSVQYSKIWLSTKPLPWRLAVLARRVLCKSQPLKWGGYFLMLCASIKSSADQSSSLVGWYVVAAKVREEQKAKLHLERQGYCVFLPQLSLRRRRNGEWKQITESLFPGYLFISLELGEDDPAPIRSTVGCIGLVRFGHTYTPVPAELIAGLRAVAANDGVAPSPFASGDIVRWVSGPFAGLEAVYDMAKGDDRALVLLELLGRVQRMTVVMDDIDK